MAKSLFTSSILFALFICFLLIASHEVQAAGPKYCERMSQTWSGSCMNSGNCNKKCINVEKAHYGACHWKKGGIACVCYFPC